MNAQPLSGSRQDIIGPRSDLNETNIVNLDRRGRPTKNNNLIFTKKNKTKNC